MNVQITHTVDRVFDEGGSLEQEYNHLVYDFVFPDEVIRARADLDAIGTVSILGSLTTDGAPAGVAHAAAGLGEVLDYLRDRFSAVQAIGSTGYEKLADGFTEAELAERDHAKEAGFYQVAQIDIDLDGDDQ